MNAQELKEILLKVKDTGITLEKLDKLKPNTEVLNGDIDVEHGDFIVRKNGLIILFDKFSEDGSKRALYEFCFDPLKAQYCSACRTFGTKSSTSIYGSRHATEVEIDGFKKVMSSHFYKFDEILKTFVLRIEVGSVVKVDCSSDAFLGIFNGTTQGYVGNLDYWKLNFCSIVKINDPSFRMKKRSIDSGKIHSIEAYTINDGVKDNEFVKDMYLDHLEYFGLTLKCINESTPTLYSVVEFELEVKPEMFFLDEYNDVVQLMTKPGAGRNKLNMYRRKGTALLARRVLENRFIKF